MGNNSENETSVLAKTLKNKNLLYSLLAIIVFSVVSWAFFYPDDVMGNVLEQHDMVQGLANGQEAKVFQEQTGEATRWTNSLFSGMPTFQIAPSYQSSGLISWVNTLYGLGFPSPVNLVFMMMIGFYILMLACDVKWYVAILGAIGYGFSSYFFIIIGAGHIWKFVTLSYVPPTIAGVIWCYKRKYLLGGAVAALFAALQIASNHIQMTYYFAFVIAAFAIGYLIKFIKEKAVKDWLKATGILLVAAIAAVGANAPNLYNTYEYSKLTMRGGSELSGAKQADAAEGETAAGGLNKDYITQWSYGVGETATLLIPNVKGGATIRPQGGNNTMMSLADTRKAQDLAAQGKISEQEYQYLAQFPQYFGDQPMTNGPVYVGALVFVLFLIGCVIVKGPVKWCLLAVTLLTVMLSWGHNFMPLTDFFIDHFPMYNKFRAVASILVVAEFTIPFLAALALNKLLQDKETLSKNIKVVYGAFGVSAAFCLLVMVFPGMFEVFSVGEKEQFIATGVAQQVPALFSAIKEIRESMISSDAMRSLIFIAMGFGVLMLYALGKLKAMVSGVALAVLVLVDMYTVNKRYISTESFVEPAPVVTSLQPRPVDKQIKQDTTQNYRVFDQQRFGDAAVSYFHKSIGGYHAAKLSRYNDLIEHQITKGNVAVIDMLNTKYVIQNDNTVFENPGALGNAWFVDTLDYVDSANKEMAYLNKFNPANQAVADVKFKNALGEAGHKEAGDTIFETTYAPNELNYHATSKNGGVAVFSEIYFPWGWKATIDGKPAEIGRVNYVLRALRVPAGSHTINFKFDPDSVRNTEKVAYASIAIIYLLVFGAIASGVIGAKRGRKEQEANEK